MSRVDVRDWVAPVSATPIAIGVRLSSYADYHSAPEGTVIRLGKRDGVGQRLVKVEDDSWVPEYDRANEGYSGPAWSSDTLEGQASYVEAAR